MRLTIAGILFAGLCGCAGTLDVEVAAAPVPAPETSFVAGFAKGDITPPPGMPTFGYSLTGQVGQGFRHRLEVRAAYFAAPNGERWSMAVVDLGAVSLLLHHSVVARLPAACGISVDRLTLSATHTHAGPGASFGCHYFNHFGATTPGFDEAWIEWLSGRIARTITEAFEARTAATIAVGTEEIVGLTHNRSLEAHLHNPEVSAQPVPPTADSAINPSATIVRVDRQDGLPLGMIASFAIHGTVLGPKIDLYHGDVHGVAARCLESRVADPGFVALLANGDEGDVRPNRTTETERSFEGARSLGEDLAARIHARYQALATPGEATLVVRADELDLELASEGPAPRPCSSALVGAPVIGGSEEGGVEGDAFKEGTRRCSPGSCQGWKKAALGPLQGVFLGADSFPRRTMVQAIRLGSAAFLALPGEMTVMMGRRLRAEVRAASGEPGDLRAWAILGLSNDFISYFATPEEYDAQHYEGASTLYGRESGPYLARELARVARQWTEPSPAPRVGTWSFPVGLRASFLPTDGGTPEGAPLISGFQVGPLPTLRVEFVTSGASPYSHRSPWLRIRTSDPSGHVSDDRGLDFEVRRRSWNESGPHATWTVQWYPPEGWPPGRSVLEWLTPDGEVEASLEFSLPGGQS